MTTTTGIDYFVVTGRLQDDLSGAAIGSDERWSRLSDVIRAICEQTLQTKDS